MNIRIILLSLFSMIVAAHGDETIDLRKSLQPTRLTIAMWDFSWLNCHYPGGAFEDFDKVTDELLERGFNTIRIDAFPLVIDQLISEHKETFLVPASPLLNWGPSQIDWKHNVVDELIELMTITKKKGIHVILSSWGKGDRTPYSDRRLFCRAWERVLDILKQSDLMAHVLYVDLDQEFPHFSPFSEELTRLGKERAKLATDEAGAMAQAGQAKGAWNKAQGAFVKEYFESTLAHFHQRYPGVRFTFSLTSFWNEVRALKPVGLDVLELHIWIKGQLNDYTGFNQTKKDRDPARDYRSYMAGIRAAMKDLDPLREHMRGQMETARSWAGDLGVPLTTTEAWGPWWHMDHPDLEWEWLYDWCEYCMGISSDYGFWGVTPWNYSHPYWENWKNVEWYRKVNLGFLAR